MVKKGLDATGYESNEELKRQETGQASRNMDDVRDNLEEHKSSTAYPSDNKPNAGSVSGRRGWDAAKSKIERATQDVKALTWASQHGYKGHRFAGDGDIHRSPSGVGNVGGKPQGESYAYGRSFSGDKVSPLKGSDARLARHQW